jgi:hypothetical protein
VDLAVISLIESGAMEIRLDLSSSVEEMGLFTVNLFNFALPYRNHTVT